MNSPSPKIRISLVLKISILAGSVAAIASLIAGSFINSSSTDSAYEDALNRLKYQTNIKSIDLISSIKNLSDDTQYLVGTPPITGIPRALGNKGIDPLDNSSLATWEDRLATIFTVLIRAKPNYLQIRYIGISDGGKELVRVDRRGDFIRTIPNNELQQKGDTPYFKNAIKMVPGEAYLSNITLNREFGKVTQPHTPVIRAAAPIYFEDKIFGVLIINMEFGKIFQQLTKNTPREIIPYVTNEEGYFLSHPDKTMTYSFDLGGDHKIQDIYPEFNLGQHNDIRDVDFDITTGDNVLHVVKAAFDPLQASRYFAIVLATPYANLQAKSITLRNKSFLITGILVFISLIIAAALTSQLLQPLKKILKASDDLANGRKISDLPINSSDEIGDLARSFNDMQHQLEDKEHELMMSQTYAHHANKLASLGEMASGMAHEINSPIQSINLVAQRVQQQLDKNMSTDEINSSMEKITDSVSKVSEIINSLRKVSRDSTNDEFTNTSIKDLIQDTTNMTEERFKVNNVNFETNYLNLSENTLIQCQHLQISQILINLVNNAYDAISKLDDKWIKINIKKIPANIQITVTDSGVGIPESIVDKIFEPMFTTKDIGSGTGLGLSISREIAAKHNGRLYVDHGSENTRIILEIPYIHSSTNI